MMKEYVKPSVKLKTLAGPIIFEAPRVKSVWED